MYPVNPYRATYYRLLVDGRYLGRVDRHFDYVGSSEDCEIKTAELSYYYYESRKHALKYTRFHDLLAYLHQLFSMVQISEKAAKKRKFAYHNKNIEFENVEIECTYHTGHCFKIPLKELIKLKKFYTLSKKLNIFRHRPSPFYVYNSYEPKYDVIINTLFKATVNKKIYEKSNFIVAFQTRFYSNSGAKDISSKEIRRLVRGVGIKCQKSGVDNNMWSTILLENFDDIKLVKLITGLKDVEVVNIKDIRFDIQGILNTF